MKTVFYKENYRTIVSVEARGTGNFCRVINIDLTYSTRWVSDDEVAALAAKSQVLSPAEARETLEFWGHMVCERLAPVDDLD